ncbi:MAG: NADH/ubiquinone/plastoquinone (complex I) [Candidatus Cloacimonetes bacterium]|nr:NADH/ubiquinone/plastoquinone (complex I) [Candidatus Cloacimonadota bacterium]
MITPYFVIIPLFAAFLIALIARKKENIAAGIALIVGIILCIMSIYSFVLLSGNEGAIYYHFSNWKAPITISLVLDYLSSFMLIIISVISLIAIFYSLQYLNHYTGKWQFFALFMLMITGMNGVALTGDFFNLFVFIEISLFSAYSLVAFGCEAEELEAAFKYAIVGAISSTLILFSVGILYSITSSLNMADVGRLLLNEKSKVIYLVYGMMIVGFGLKSALVPFHAWLPDAHPSAPAPISSMLSGVLIKVLGIYALIRVFFNVFGAPQIFLQIILILGIISMVVGGLMSLMQWDIKRLLGFSTVSQVGYIFLGIGLGTPLGILGAIFHLLNHSIFKALLFMNAGAVEYALDTRDMKQMGGLSKKLPITSTTSMIGSLSISGIPPFNGFFSKLIIIIACIQAGHPIYAGWAILISIITLAYYLKMQRFTFYGKQNFKKIFEKVPFTLKTSMIILAGLCVISSVLIIPGIKEVTLDKVTEVILDKTKYIEYIKPLILGGK